MIDKLSSIIFIATICVLILFGLFLFAFIFYRKKKQKALREEESYRHIDTDDSVNFIPIDDIRDDMIIDENGKRFTAGIICTGSDFFYESVDEKIRIQNGYIGFWHALRSDMTYRQSAENINLDHTIKLYEDAHKKVEAMYYNLNADYNVYKNKYDMAYEKNEPIDAKFEQMLIGMQKQLRSLQFRLLHIEDQLKLANRMAGPSANAQKNVMMYLYSWEQPTGLMGEGLRDSELYERAQQELKKLTDQNIRHLASCGVSAKRATTFDLIDQFRKQTHPFSGNSFSTSDIYENTTWGDDVVQTDSFIRAKDNYYDNVAESIIYGGSNGTV